MREVCTTFRIVGGFRRTTHSKLSSMELRSWKMYSSFFYNRRPEISDLENRIVALVETFSKSPNLKQLEIRGWPRESPLRLHAVANLCSRVRLLRGHAVSLRVLYIDYE